jgi:hypothetical protein
VIPVWQPRWACASQKQQIRCILAGCLVLPEVLSPTVPGDSILVLNIKAIKRGNHEGLTSRAAACRRSHCNRSTRGVSRHLSGPLAGYEMALCALVEASKANVGKVKKLGTSEKLVPPYPSISGGRATFVRIVTAPTEKTCQAPSCSVSRLRNSPKAELELIQYSIMRPAFSRGGPGALAERSTGLFCLRGREPKRAKAAYSA